MGEQGTTSDGFNEHCESLAKRLGSITVPMVGVMAFLDRNGDLYQSRDYLVVISLQVLLFALSELVGHLRHRKQLQSSRA